MEKKKLEQLLDSMGIAYTHTASRASSQCHQSLGHYNIGGAWIEDEMQLNLEPDGVLIRDLRQQTQICEYCNVIVDGGSEAICKISFRAGVSRGWEGRCKTCDKTMDFNTFFCRKKSSN
jgi:hypothetical protein